MHPGPFFVSVAGAVLFAFASIGLTTALGRATDEVLKPAFAGGVEPRKIWLAVAALMTFGCLRALGIMLRRFFSGVAGERVMATLRTRIADRYRRLALAYHRETPTGELLAHMEADVKAAVDVFWPVPFATGVIVLIVLAMIQLIATDIFLALIAAVVFPALAVMNRNFAKRMQGPAARAQERIGEVSAVAHESIDGALVVKTLGRETAETERLAIKARALRDERVDAGFLRATFEAALDALPALVATILLLVGSWRVAAGGLTLGRLIGFIALFDLLAWPMRFIGWILAELPRAVVGYARIEQVFGEPITVLPAVDPQPLPDGPLGLDAEDLHHSLDGTRILDGVSLRIGPRESVAIVGETGGGKSTLAQLLVRLADPESGDRAGRRDRPPARGAGCAQARRLDRVPGELPVLHDDRREHRARLRGERRRDRTSGADRGGRPFRGHAARRVPDRRRRARLHVVGRGTPARRARARDRA